MYYIYAKVIWSSKKMIIIEDKNIGLKINVINGENFLVSDKLQKIYIFKNIKIDYKNNLTEEYYGFDNYAQRNLFVDLISINGIGSITAFNIITNDINILLNLIAENNVEALAKLNFITQKNAILICNALSSKYAKFISSNNISSKKSELISELIYALKKLGYKNEDLKVVNEIEIENEIELSELIAKSIKLIALKNEQ